MSHLDGLKRILPHKDKTYRPNSRINFLINQARPEAAPEEAAANQVRFHRPATEGKKHALIKIALISFLIIIISGVMYLSEKLFSPGGGLSGFNKFNPLSQLAYLVSPADKRIDGELSDRVNILAMGIGGEGHDGPYLTDTMIVISVKPSTGEVGLLSLPRDMVVKLKNGEWPKINSVYSLGRGNDPDQAPEYVKEVIGDLVDLPMHYYGIVTFSGFEKFIDEIGGISVNAPMAFTDYQYPTKDYQVQTVSFRAGAQTMDGTDALIYARSRNGNNFEGSDFARSRRQQLILQAVKDKLFKFSTLLSPAKMGAIKDLLGKGLETNISIWQGLKIAQMLKETDDAKIYHLVLDDAPDSLLEPGYGPDGAWVLQPKDGNYETLARQFKNIFNTGKIKAEAAKLEIKNGTEVEGLAYWTTVYLEKLGYKIIKYGNAATQDYQRTVIYDLTDSGKKDSLKWLKQELNAYIAKPPAEGQASQKELTSSTTAAGHQERPDFLIILGTDYASTFKLPEQKPIQTTSTKPLLLQDADDALATTSQEISE